MLLQLLQNLFRFASLRDATKRARDYARARYIQSVVLPFPHHTTTRHAHHIPTTHDTTHDAHTNRTQAYTVTIRFAPAARSSPPRASRARRPTTTTTTLNPSHEHTHTHPTPRHRHRHRHPRAPHTARARLAQNVCTHSCGRLRVIRSRANERASRRIASHLCRIVPVKRIDDRIERADVTAQHRLRAHRPRVRARLPTIRRSPSSPGDARGGSRPIMTRGIHTARRSAARVLASPY